MSSRPALGMAALLLVAALAVGLTPARSGAGTEPEWIEVLRTTQSLHGVAFPDPQQGWAVGDSATILSTGDGGQHWDTPSANLGCTGLHHLYGATSPDPSTAWAAAHGGILGFSAGAWGPQVDPCTDTRSTILRGIDSSSSEVAWAAGSINPPDDETDRLGVIMVTTDGGATWVDRAVFDLSKSVLLNGIAAASDGQHAWAVGCLTPVTSGCVANSTPVVVATTDGGQTWSPQDVPTGTPFLNGVAFVDAQRGWAVGAGGTILATTDSGATWTQQATETPRELRGVSFADAAHGIAVGAGGTILATSDGGSTWLPEDSGLTTRLEAVSFPPGQTEVAYAVGDLAILKRTATVPLPPVVTGLDPNHASIDGGELVSIQGERFEQVLAVRFGDVILSQSTYSVQSRTEILAEVPGTDEPGQVYVTVTTPGGTSAQTPDSLFTYTAPAADTWEATGSMNVSRTHHAAVQLADGRVLVMGGQGARGAILDSAELYDPLTKEWTTTGSLNQARMDHTATLLRDNTVLVVGGSLLVGNVATAEIYDPVLGTWTFTAEPLALARSDHTATLLPDGRVLVAGGFGENPEQAGSSLSQSEIFDPTVEARGLATETWTSTGDMLEGRGDGTATLLEGSSCGGQCGKVLAVGGYRGTDFDATGPIADAELYDPATGVWSRSAQPDFLHQQHTATALRDGRVLVVSGSSHQCFCPTPSTELYAGDSSAWSPAGLLDTERSFHTATMLPDGRVTVAGGYRDAGTTLLTLGSAEVFDPLTGWSVTGAMTGPRRFHTATLLEDGTVLVAGGSDDDQVAKNTAELFTPPPRGGGNPPPPGPEPGPIFEPPPFPDGALDDLGPVAAPKANRPTPSPPSTPTSSPPPFAAISPDPIEAPGGGDGLPGWLIAVMVGTAVLIAAGVMYAGRARRRPPAWRDG